MIEVTTGEGGLVEAFTRNGNLQWSVTLPVFFESGVRMHDPKAVHDFHEIGMIVFTTDSIQAQQLEEKNNITNKK